MKTTLPGRGALKPRILIPGMLMCASFAGILNAQEGGSEIAYAFDNGMLFLCAVLRLIHAGRIRSC